MKLREFVKALLISTVLLSEHYVVAAEVPQAESIKLLNGARTLAWRPSVYAVSECAVDQRQLTLVTDQLIAGYDKLKKVDETSAPDMFLTLSVDATLLQAGDTDEKNCMYLVSLRAVHPMFGQLRYSTEGGLIQALTFNRSMYSVITASKINEAVQLQAMKLWNLMFSVHRAGQRN